MTLWKDMAVYDQEWLWSRAERASQDMHSAVCVALGPSGRAVMAQSPSRLTITRSGGHILNLAFPSPPDPVFSFLLKAATDFHHQFGDGVKTFVIFLHSLIHQVQFKKAKFLIQKIQTFKSCLDSCFLTDKTCLCIVSNDILQNVINTFFFTRFAPSVSETLAKLVFEWVSKLNNIADISIYVLNFSVLTLKFSPFSITSSSIKSGFLLKGLYPKKLPLDDNRCVLKVFYVPSDSSLDEGDLEAEIVDVLSVKDKNSCVLFVTNIVLEERALFILNCRNIYFIHGVSNDSTKFLFENSLVLDFLFVEYQHLKELLWISLPNVQQLLLYSPNPQLSAEYSEGILDCLKMLFSCLKDCSCTITTNVSFEHAFARQIFNQSNHIGSKTPPTKGRKQILTWNVVGCAESKFLKHIDSAKLQGMEVEVRNLICSALMSIPVVENDDNASLQPLNLHFEIISGALHTLINLCKLDAVFIKPKKGRLV